ncbi:MAG: hypothetical protein U0822_08815 [Anaerolineae bacterium]
MSEPRLPRIVIEIKDGIVAAVYWGDNPAMFAVVDHDEANWGDDYIGVDYTQPLDDLPAELAAAIRAIVQEET